MIAKIRCRIVFDFTYDADSKDYGTDDLEEMLKIDRENIQADGPYAILGDVEPTIELSIVKDENNGN